MLHIRLGELDPDEPATDPPYRCQGGWREGMTPQEVFRLNRGRWVLGSLADHQQYVVFSAKGADGRLLVRAAARITGIVPDPEFEGKRRILQGTVLAAGHPVHDTYVGGPSPVPQARNPVSYFDSELDELPACRCGCGETVEALGNQFVVGHDRTAVAERVMTAGGAGAFIEWFDRTWPTG